MWKRYIGWMAACLLGVVGFAFDPGKDVDLSVKQGVLVVQIPAKVHLKKDFMTVGVAPGQKGKVALGKLPPTTGKDELGDAVWHGTQRFPLVAEGISGTVKLVVTYQPCTEGEGGACFPPTDRSLSVSAAELPSMKAANKVPEKIVSNPSVATDGRMEMAPALPPPAPVIQTPGTVPRVDVAQAPVSEAPRQGLLLALLLVFLAGMGASLTPCVYPMIPITMAIIGAKGGGKAKGFSLSLMLVLGMAVTYTTLGVVAAKSGSAFGAFAQRPAFLIPVSVIFAVFALSLFGAFEISLPQGLQNRLQGSGPRKGYAGAFVMGLVLGPLAAPCVGPVIGAVLVGIAQQGSVALGALKLFVFTLGMGVLFMLVGTFSAGLPKSGDWLTRFKHIMGLVVLGFAAWNIRLLVPEWANDAMWMLTLLVGAAVFGAFEAAEGLVAQLRRGFALLMLVLGLLLGIRAVENSLHLQLLPREGATASVESAPKTWMEQDLEGALKRAKAEHKLVLVDIYAEWCAQCKELDEKTWPDADVKAWIAQNAIAIRIDTDKQRPDLAKKLEIRSYPSVILLDGEGREVRRSLGFQKPQGMLAFLNAR